MARPAVGGPWHDARVTLLQVLIVLAVIAGVAAAATGAVGGGLGEATSTEPDAELPPGRLASRDVADVRFSLGLRGYRMDEVDRVLDRVCAEIDEQGAEIERLRGELSRPRAADVVQDG